MFLFKQEKYDSPRQVFFKSYEMFKYDVTWRKNTQCNVKIILHNEYVFIKGQFLKFKVFKGSPH